MAVRENRNRYVVFEIGSGRTDRRGMIRAIRRAFSRDEYEDYEPWLTVFEGDKGIIRFDHMGKERVLELLDGIEVGGGEVRTTFTSGTIKRAKEKLESE